MRRHVVLDGAGGPLGADEADGARALAPGADPVPPRRAADHRVQPRGAAAHPGGARRGRAGVGAGHQPPARPDARARHLRRHPEAEPVVLVVTDGEPTAHLERRRRPAFHWPATRATLRATVAQVDELRRSRRQLNVFMLGEDPGLARFVDAVARRAGGRVFTPTSTGSASTSSPTTSEPAAAALSLRKSVAGSGRRLSWWRDGASSRRAAGPHRGLLRLRPARRRDGRAGRPLHAVRRRRGHRLAVLRAAPAGRHGPASPPRTYAACSSASRSSTCRAPSSGSTR